MRLDQIWKYPVKSMLGSRVDTAELAEEGIVGDRIWALRDERYDFVVRRRDIERFDRDSGRRLDGS